MYPGAEGSRNGMQGKKDEITTRTDSGLKHEVEEERKGRKTRQLLADRADRVAEEEEGGICAADRFLANALS